MGALSFKGASLCCAVAVLFATARAAGEPDAPVSRDNLYAVKFATPTHGWAVGEFGVILHTGDGGKSWRLQASDTTEPLFGVDFVDEKRGWAVGRSGIILHTGDGGHTWQRQSSGVDDKHLFRVDFVDAELGCAVGDWGTIVLTRDGGKTWRVNSLPNDVIINGLWLVDRTRGWITGELGMIMVTEDGGETWTERRSGVDKTLFAIQFADASTGWAVGIDALILHTTDGGDTWQIRHGSAEMAVLDQVGFAQALDYPSLYGLSMSGQNGIAVGDTGSVYLTADGGLTWERQTVPFEWGLSWFRDVSTTAGGHGALVGAEGHHPRIAEGRLQVEEKR